MSRTPVSMLQELMQKRGTIPQYEELPSEGIGTHEPTFYMRVKVGDISKIGKARSKKDAKHEAAKLALEALSVEGIYHDKYYSKTPASPSVQSSSSDSQINAVGTLKDICAENNIPDPEFNELASVGPPHAPEFTIECKIGKMPAVCATGLTKKKAKQAAAQKMLDRFKKSLPELLEEFTETSTVSKVPAITQDVISKYNENTMQKKKINWGLRVSSYPKTMKKIMEEKKLTYDSLWKDVITESEDAECLANILNKLGLASTINIEEIGNRQVLFLSINSDPEFLLAQTLKKHNEEYSNLITEAFKFLRILTK